MNRRVCMSVVSSGIFVLRLRIGKCARYGAAATAAHGDAARPRPEVGMIGERIELLGFEGMHGGKVVTGVPFQRRSPFPCRRKLSRTETTSRERPQTNVYRDSQGRFRKEVTLPAIGPLATSGQPMSFVFNQ